jgi:ABC-type multidrug transport system permease subunit
MIRKWLWLLLVLAVLYAASTFNARKRQARYPILKRIDKTITMLVWILLASYGFTFLYWLYTQVIR